METKLAIVNMKLSGIPSQVIAGDAFRVVATPFAQGGVHIDRVVSTSFKSSDARVASVDAATGQVTALNPGRVTITAAGEGKSGTETFVVAPKPANNVTTIRIVLTAPPPIRVGESAPFRVAMTPASTSTDGMTWSSSNDAVARVDARTGEVTGVSRGTSTITARLGKIEQRDDVEILAAEVASIQAPASHSLKESETVRLTATPLGRQGQPLRDRAIAWSSDHPDIVSVSDDGMITGRSGGSATITAATEGRAARIAVRVESKPVPVPPPVARTDPPARDADADASAARAAAAQQLAARPAEVLQVLTTQNGSRAAGLFANDTPDEQRYFAALRDKLTRREAELKASDLQAGSVQMGDSQGTLDFKIRLSWITAVGREKSAMINFQARTQRTGAGWRVATVKILSELK